MAVVAHQPRTRVATPRLGLTALIVAIVVARFALADRSFFSQDDFIYFGDARAKGLTWDWLSTGWFQHFGPGHRFAFWAMDATHGSWTAILVLQCALLGAALLALHASLVLLFGRSPVLFVPVVLLGCSIVLVPPLLWPSAGLQQLPDLACGLGVVWAYLRYQREPSRRWVLVCAGLLALGLLFYIRPLLVPVYLLAIRLLLLQADLRPRTVAKALWAERWLWLALGAVVAVYLANYLGGDYRGDPGPTASLATVEAFVRIEWLRNVWPAALGREVAQVPTLHGADLRSEIGGQVLFVALLAGSLLRNGLRAWRGWAFVGVGFALILVLVGMGRLGVLGTGVGYDLRYITNLAWMVPLGVLFAFDGRAVLTVGDPWPPPAPRRRSARVPARAGSAVLVVGCALYAVSTLHTAAVKQDNWFGHFARSWTDQARGSLAALAAEGVPVDVLDGDAPDYVIEPGFTPANRLANVLPSLGEPVTFDDPAGPLYVVDATGAVVRGQFTRAWQGSGGRCVTGPAPIELRLPQPLPAGSLLVVRTPGATIGPAGVPVFVDAGAGYPGTTDRILRAPRVGTAGLDLHAGSLATLRFDPAPGERLCLPAVTVGRVTAASP